MHFPHPHHVSSFIFQIKLVNTSRKYFINSSMLLNENWLTRSAHMSTTERRKVLAESYWMASRLVQVIANLSLNFQQHHTYLFETPTSLRLLGHHHSRFSSVWSLAASLSTAHHLCHNSVFLKTRDIYIYTHLSGTYIIMNRVRSKLLLACQALRPYITKSYCFLISCWFFI